MPKFKGTALEHKAATLLKSHMKGFLERQKFLVTKRHILEDRKMIRGLKNNEEGLPDVLRAVFLALTEDKTDARGGPSKLKATIRELQQKDPILFRQFQREVMKQYANYQMTHHRNRNSFTPKTKVREVEQERKSLITSLKNAMTVIQNKSQFTSIVLDDNDEPTSKKTLDGSPRMNFERKHVATPTMVFGTLMAMNDEIREYS